MSPPPSSAGRQSTIEQLTLELSEGYMSTHLATISTALAQLVHQIVTGYSMNIDHQLSIVFPSELATDNDIAGLASRTISISYKTFQGAHVSDLLVTFRPPRRGARSSGAELPIPDDGLHLFQDLALRVMQLLSDESCALNCICR
ncbi:uncharacterized protein E5676_scaffold447G001600 [Cucumis melo var. makuwa]|uniref:Flocculation protein FLO11-like n=1 Tax=Cucumis melo var. makuwa TaxID=1194695 RepID=A0A5A7TPB3_CUCMM|nr:uncharacterized protein E6C27_scaffold320G00700 [Cucumis melo var. makuwa]TYK09738.1 uncharacterized protein E5676_scaffold447G001600 [Cucumis melo var. makuwa]